MPFLTRRLQPERVLQKAQRRQRAHTVRHTLERDERILLMDKQANILSPRERVPKAVPRFVIRQVARARLARKAFISFAIHFHSIA
ncbi:hypothetical protein [Caballeronia humi]|uniref:hypothetical protein n=1 Tax=Caballeronia humi TaxID=326474 RepID=UPI000F73C3DD|nr:hypothetical protein [Caballeronia humi]